MGNNHNFNPFLFPSALSYSPSSSFNSSSSSSFYSSSSSSSSSSSPPSSSPSINSPFPPNESDKFTIINGVFGVTSTIKFLLARFDRHTGNTQEGLSQLYTIKDEEKGSEEDSEEEMQLLMELGPLMSETERERMQSKFSNLNLELWGGRQYARQSRMRKQRQLDDLMSKVAQLRKVNNQILASLNITTQHYFNVERESSILRAQVIELSQRLCSIHDHLLYQHKE